MYSLGPLLPASAVMARVKSSVGEKPVGVDKRMHANYYAKSDQL